MKILPLIFCEQPFAIFSNNSVMPANPKKQSKKIPILFVILLTALCSYTEAIAQYSAADDDS